ncbi:hypothetical protein ULG90_12150 [Halopseudomonas pachastrellae]|nr:hypothetical protein ULG90_12150 [Halopseudomonas pachastrellae]
MHTAGEIPSWDDTSHSGLFKWWQDMARSGLIHHPDDDPATIVYVENNNRFFDSKACDKLREIYSRMENTHGALTYTAGAKAMRDILASK